jgi:hypothetical protein
MMVSAGYLDVPAGGSFGWHWHQPQCRVLYPVSTDCVEKPRAGMFASNIWPH